MVATPSIHSSFHRNYTMRTRSLTSTKTSLCKQIAMFTFYIVLIMLSICHKLKMDRLCIFVANTNITSSNSSSRSISFGAKRKNIRGIEAAQRYMYIFMKCVFVAYTLWMSSSSITNNNTKYSIIFESLLHFNDTCYILLQSDQHIWMWVKIIGILPMMCDKNVWMLVRWCCWFSYWLFSGAK